MAKVKPEEIVQVNFGVTVKLNDETKGRQITGVYPSHSIPDFEELVNKVIDFLNEQLGTKFQAVRVYVEEDLLHTCGDCGNELAIVRPGKYQCLNCEKENANGKQTKEVAVETN